MLLFGFPTAGTSSGEQTALPEMRAQDVVRRHGGRQLGTEMLLRLDGLHREDGGERCRSTAEGSPTISDTITGSRNQATHLFQNGGGGIPPYDQHEIRLSELWTESKRNSGAAGRINGPRFSGPRRGQKRIIGGQHLATLCGGPRGFTNQTNVGDQSWH